MVMEKIKSIERLIKEKWYKWKLKKLIF
jgi:hypothetical protein